MIEQARGLLPILLLGCLAATLAGIIVWQIAERRRPEDRPIARSAQPQRAAPAATAPPPSRSAALAAASLERPLFSPTRRPPSADAAISPAAEPPLPRLTGVLVTAEGRSAIFAGNPQPVVVQEGGSIGGFVVRTIEPGQVTLSAPNGTRIIRPEFDTRVAAPQGLGQAVGQPAARPGSGPPPLIGLKLMTGGERPPIPGSSPGRADAPQDAMPFSQKPSPTGSDILRNQAGQAPVPVPPR